MWPSSSASRYRVISHPPPNPGCARPRPRPRFANRAVGPRVPGPARRDTAPVAVKSFTFSDLLGILAKQGFSAAPEAVKRSLVRLVLAFILRQKDGGYYYPVPLFRELVKQQDPEACLQEEIRRAP